MRNLNYHHLLYFYVAAREGGVGRASETLGLAQPTVSGQIKMLEDSLGERLFQRQGRGLALTETGRVVYRYAEEIFGLGREMMDALKGRPTGRPLRLSVGVADVVPKLVAWRLLQPALSMPDPVQLVVREDHSEKLLAELATHGLDLVITDAPLPPGMHVRAYSHLLGETGVTVYAAAKQAAALRRNFPRSLDGMPFLMPAAGTSLRLSLEQWFEAEGVRPRVVAEFDDSALLKTFGQAGAGAFASPDAIADEVKRQYAVAAIGKVARIKERFYAVSVERRLKHPAVLAITEGARKEVFG